MKKLSLSLTLFALISCEVKEQQRNSAISSETPIKLSSNLDPICKMDVQTNRTDTVLYQGKTYGFCSPRCKEKFIENPNIKQ